MQQDDDDILNSNSALDDIFLMEKEYRNRLQLVIFKRKAVFVYKKILMPLVQRHTAFFKLV